MSQFAPTASASNQEVIRRFLTLTIAYSLSIISAAVGFYFYVVFPLWLWFAYSSTRFDSDRSLRTTVRLLTVSVILWIAFSVPLFFFVTGFGPLVYAAEVSAILIGSVVVYLAASPFAAGNPPNIRARRIGLAAAAATAANLVVLGVFGLLGIGMTIFVGGVAVVYVLLFLVGLVASVISAVSFIRIAIWTRKRIESPLSPSNATPGKSVRKLP